MIYILKQIILKHTHTLYLLHLQYKITTSIVTPDNFLRNISNFIFEDFKDFSLSHSGKAMEIKTGLASKKEDFFIYECYFFTNNRL